MGLWDFWQAPSVSPNEPSTALDGRTMNLTELRAFAEDVARAAGQDGTVQLVEDMGMVVPRRPMEWNVLRDRLNLDAVELRAAPPGVDALASPPQVGVISVRLGGGLGVQLSTDTYAGMGPGVELAQRLAIRWRTYGRRRRGWAAAWPVALLAAVAAVSVPALVLIGLGHLSPWLTPAAIALGALLFTTGLQWTRHRVGRSLARASSLRLITHTMEELRATRVAMRLQLRSGLIGAVLGVAGSIVVALITSK